MERRIAIYKTMEKATGKVVYIGQTKCPDRVGKHYFGSGKNIKGKYTLPQLKEMFIAEVITTTESQDEANKLERYYIDFYHTLEEHGGLNQSKGGLGGGHYGHDMTNRKDLSKPVLQYTKNGDFVAEYPSLGEAQRQTGIGYTHISDCCNGKRKSTGGFVWRYKDIL